MSKKRKNKKRQEKNPVSLVETGFVIYDELHDWGPRTLDIGYHRETKEEMIEEIRQHVDDDFEWELTPEDFVENQWEEVTGKTRKPQLLEIGTLAADRIELMFDEMGKNPITAPATIEFGIEQEEEVECHYQLLIKDGNPHWAKFNQ